MSQFVVNGVRLDTLLAMEKGHIVDAVPPEERSRFAYWRGAHLGKIALNLIRGKMTINAGETDNLIHFSDSYERDGLRIAGNIANSRTDIQWTAADAKRFAELTGVPAPAHFAAAVIAARFVGYWQTSKHDLGWGYSVEEPMGFNEVDPYSLQALEGIFEVDLLQPSVPAEGDFSHRPAPSRGVIVPSEATYSSPFGKPGRRY